MPRATLAKKPSLAAKAGKAKRARTLADLIKRKEELERQIAQLSSQTEPAVKKPRTGAELVKTLRASGFIGMWKDRTDIGDSCEFARKLRARASKRNWD